MSLADAIEVFNDADEVVSALSKPISTIKDDNKAVLVSTCRYIHLAAVKIKGLFKDIQVHMCDFHLAHQETKSFNTLKYVLWCFFVTESHSLSRNFDQVL